MSVIGVQMAKRYAFRDAAEFEEQAVTVRPSSSALFCIDSADRYASYNARALAPTTPYTFSISKNESLLNGFFKRIALTEVVFPYYIPNINSKTDQIQVSINGGGLITLTLAAQGFLTPQQIAGNLEAQLIANGLAAATVDYNQGVFVFETNTVDTIAFARGNYGGLGARINEFQLYDLLNLSGPGANGLQTAATTIVSGVTRCRYTEYIDIVCSQLTYNQELKDGSSDPIVRDMVARIYLEDESSNLVPIYQTAAPAGPVMPYDTVLPGTYPFTVYRKFTMPKQILWDKAQPLGNLTFEVYDDKGQILSSHLGSVYPDSTMPDWRVTLLVSEN